VREPERIKRICKLLEKAWNKVPDQRLGQFMDNYIFNETNIFYQEDKPTEKILEEFK